MTMHTFVISSFNNIYLGMKPLIQVALGCGVEFQTMLLFILNLKCCQFGHMRKALESHLLLLSKEM